ncbi:ribonucleotide reductase [Rhizobium phage vB_RleS_L338C]|uniref:ribonucleotide reductase n=1 Tax=Rhizobium phage vB_RleS_L338C TaxID=1414737 RepID=UPI0003D8CF55|nr:ribonucleotide reductase [Rhizobium phage vB_RleS_L338C]AHC30496.1 ribonucleoside-thiphosphate reductase [Rhizobium phage vB_RleS_L338C]
MDKLTHKNDGIQAYVDGLYAEGNKYAPDEDARQLMIDIAEVVLGLSYTMITNPCGEICLLLLGAYCVIADVVPFHAQNDDDAEDAFRTAVRALIRTNLMDCLYNREVSRTNRIGVGITGFHEWAYARFGFTWHDLVDEEKSKELWMTLARFKRAIDDEAQTYSKVLGVTVPHTNTTFKPAGTTSKLFGLTEGAHLPSMREYLRWVQFRHDDPLVQQYEERGYPIMHLKSYEGTTVVGFPTRPTICDLGSSEWVVTAAEATPEDQYQFLRNLEKYWIHGVDEDGAPLPGETGNQVSYTLKYDPEVVTFEQFFHTLIEGQFSIRCCSVMPQADTSAYEYQPETPVSKHEFEMIAEQIAEAGRMDEDIGKEHIDCSTGACPVDFVADEKEDA